MPLEYTLTGLSMKSPSPEKSMIESIRSSMSRRESPRMAPLRYAFSRPDSSGWNPAPSSSSADTRPWIDTEPLFGRWMPAMTRSSVDFPDPLCPISP